MKLAFVDTLDAYRWANANGFELIATDNPVLARDPATQGRLINADAAIAQDEANRFGMQAIVLAEDLDKALRASRLPQMLDLPAERLQLAGASCRVISSLVYRALSAARAVAAHEPTAIGIGATDQSLVGSDGVSLARLHFPMVTLAEHGFFGSLPVQQERFAEPAARHHADVPQDLVRRSMHLPLGFLLLEATRRIGLAPRGKKVFVLGENEALRETLPHLVRAGYQLQRLGKPAITAQPGVGSFDLPDEIAHTINQGISGLGLFNLDEAKAVAFAINRWFAGSLARLAAEWPNLRAQIGRSLEGEVQPAVLTNGLFGPRGALIYAALREAGATVIDFEHGVTTGLSAHSQAKINFSEASTSDVVLCCSETAVSAFAEAREAPARRIEAVGLADQTRRLFRPWLQRRVARKALSLSAREETVFHVSTWSYYGNLRPGFGIPTETFVEALERRLIEDVYGHLNKSVVYKPYPTERLAYSPALQARMTVPGNIRICPAEDLRYFRAAADLMVTGVPTSTLGWVAGTDVPIIWLASKTVFPFCSSALDEDVAASFLAVDMDQEDWTSRLLDLLSRPLADIRAEWDSKQASRDAFLVRAVTGPKGSTGARAAKVVRDVINNGLPA